MIAYEVKSRTKAHVIRAKDNLASQIRSKFGSEILPTIKAFSSEFYKYVPEKPYRLQLLHHATVSKILNICYIEACKGRVVYAINIVFTIDQLRAYYLSYLHPFYFIHLKPLVDSLRDHAKAKDNLKSVLHLGYACDVETIRLHVILQDLIKAKIMELNYGRSPDQFIPLPPCRHLKPEIVILHCRLKTGVDTMTQSTSYQLPKNRTTIYGKIFNILWSQALYNSQRTFRVKTLLYSNWNFNSIDILRDRLRKTITFRQFTNLVVHEFSNIIKPSGWNMLAPFTHLTPKKNPIPATTSKKQRILKQNFREFFVQYSKDTRVSLWRVNTLYQTQFKINDKSFNNGITMAHNKVHLEERHKCINCCASVKHKENNNHGTCGFANKKRTGTNTLFGCSTCAYLVYFTAHGGNMPEGAVEPIPLCPPCWEIHHQNVDYPTPHYSLYAPTDVDDDSDDHTDE
jgi:hypothetical protein